LPTSLTAADLTGSGLQDLIAANDLDNSVTIALQTSPGRFGAPKTVPAGVAPSDVAAADIDGDGSPDILVTNQASGEVTILLNDLQHTFHRSLVLAAGAGPYLVKMSTGSPTEGAFAEPVSVVVGAFMGIGRTGVAILDQATHSVVLLAANEDGGLDSPRADLTISTSDGLSINNRPIAMVGGAFTLGGPLDLAVLMEDTGEVWIYSGDGSGHFRHTFSIPVGNEATGLTVVPGTRPGLFDLLVGNGFGDVLILEGKGDGTFQIRGNRVSLSVVPNLLGKGEAAVLVANQASNRVTVQAPSAGGNQYAPVQTLGSSGSSTQLAPGDVQWAFLEPGSTLPDAIVVSTGSNSVVVYHTLSIVEGAPTFAPSPRTYFVGTAPASVTVADINGDGIPDMLIANQGSNDVSVLFGSEDAQGRWVGIPGPRLKSGGDGPIAVSVTRINGSSLPDLVVFNGGSGTVTLLPAVGDGFFDDRDPRTLFNLGSSVLQPPTFVGDGGLGYVVTAERKLVRFNLQDPSSGPAVVYSAEPVLAAEALSTGQVVAALGNGDISLLGPLGNGLAVASVLEAEGGSAASPSAIDVVSKPSGGLDVLVSSQGSDTIFVYAQAAALPVSSSPILPVTPPPTSAAFQPPTTSAPSQSFLLTSATATTTASQAAVAVTTTASTSSSSATTSAATTTTVGLSLGTFSSLARRSTNGGGGAILVPVEGNTYLSVPILDTGTQSDAEETGAGGRMPWLSGRYKVGDASELTRFVIGLDAALEAYRGSEEEPVIPGSGRLRDPWREDLFQPHPPIRSGSVEGAPAGPGAMRLGPLDVVPEIRIRERMHGVDPSVMPTAEGARTGGVILALTELLGAGLRNRKRLCSMASGVCTPVGPSAVRARRWRYAWTNSRSRESC
jgi:hypothetical protein